MAEQMIATREWHRRAIVRFKREVKCRSFAGDHTYRAGQEIEMVQWGRAGRPVDDAWWSDFDIDEAYIVKADNVEVITVLDEVSPVVPRSYEEIETELQELREQEESED